MATNAKKYTSLAELLQGNRAKIALIIGNGINRYGAAAKTNSWHDLLLTLARQHLALRNTTVPRGISLTEFYDVIELKSRQDLSARNLQQEFCELMSSWAYYGQHQRIVAWAQEANAPILTTNFEHILEEAGNCKLYRTRKGGFTDLYPWESYFGSRQLTDPTQGFGIWHINGMQHYHRSIRLGLSHYMGSVDRARGWLHNGGDRLLAGNKMNVWRGATSWLQIMFHFPLLIIGLGLEENEVFLRWLLIERARYYKKFPERKMPAWYVHKGSLNSDGKRFFLEGVGIQALNVAGYRDIYGETTWG